MNAGPLNAMSAGEGRIGRFPADRLALAALISLSTLLLSCATMQTVSLDKRSRVYVAKYESVINAIVDYCNDRGFPIQSYAKELGLINTDYREGDPISAAVFGGIRLRLNFQARNIDTARVRVILFASAEDAGGAFGRWRQTALLESAAEDLYGQIFNGIEQYLGSNASRDDVGSTRVDRSQYAHLVSGSFKAYDKLRLMTFVFIGGRSVQTYVVGEDEESYIATISRTNSKIVQVYRSSLKEVKVQ